jgi:Domain of unknown function (DUF4865)
VYAMQYEITLPADYDMGIIRHRVATKGSLLDGFAGLGLKAYLVRERGTDGSAVNEYAPFYLWDAVDGMGRFLWGGGGFAGIVDSFGRPTVRHWTGVAHEPGPEWAATPRVATRATEALAPEEEPRAAVDRALAELRERARTDGVHSTALAVDPHHWELVHFTLWRDSSPPAVGTRYQVLHLSRGSGR